MCRFFSGTKSHVKLLLPWPVIHYQVTFDSALDKRG